MDDRSTGVGGERTSGRSDEEITGRSDERTATRTSGIDVPRTDERGPGAVSTSTSMPASRVESREPARSDPRTHQIRAEIERTRGDMSETIDAIQDRLRPSNIASNAVSSVRNATSARVRDVADSDFVQDLRANPIPTAMIGLGVLGLAWLAVSGREGRHDYRRRSYRRGYDYDYYERDFDETYREGAGYYRGSRWRPETAGAYTPGLAYETGESSSGAGGYTGEAGRRASEYAGRASEYAGDASRRVRYRTRRATNGLQRMMHENPLMVGAAAAVLGAAVGLALPETEQENEWLGETRDNMIENAQHMAQDAAERVKDAAATAATKAVTGLAGSSSEGEKSEQRQGEQARGRESGQEGGQSQGREREMGKDKDRQKGQQRP